MHTKPMPDSAGNFDAPETTLYICRKCGQKTAVCRLWESSCGGYEDYKYKCRNVACNHSWWVEGPDS